MNPRALSLLFLSPQIRGLLLTALLLGATAVSMAQDVPPPANAAAILKELDQVSLGAKSKVQSRRSAAISQVQLASSAGPAAAEFFATALNNTKFREKPQDFAEWRRKNQDVLMNLSYQDAALLQLRYLVLALQRSEQLDAYAQIPECLAYLNQLSSHNLRYIDFPRPDGASKQKRNSAPTIDTAIPEAKDLLNQSLVRSPVVEWLQISDLLPDGKDFAASGGDYQAILDTNVRNALREKHDQRLAGTWDTQISSESAIATASHSQQQIDAFNQTRIPELLYKKAQDTAAIGQPNRALGEVVVLIRNYPANPSVKDWIENARALLTNSVTPVSAGITATATSNTIPLQAPTTNGPVAPPVQPANH